MIALGVLGVMMMAAVIGVCTMDDEQAADAKVGETFTVGDLNYIVMDDGTAAVTGPTSTSISGHVEIPSTAKGYVVARIYTGAFERCSDITSVTFPSSLEQIMNKAFYYCKGLTSVTIPGNHTHICSFAFEGCSALASVILLEGVWQISDDAFANCGITEITIPSSVEYINNNPFRGCDKLEKYIVDSNNANYSSIGGVLYTKNVDEILSCPAAKIGEFIIPSSVTSIRSEAFYGCSGLTSISIPDNVTSIESYVFYQCTGLASITIPENVTSIKNYAFGYCYSLTSVTIPENVTSIESYVFYQCTGLTSVIFESSNAPELGTNSFKTSTEISVWTPGWDPVETMANAIGTDGKTTIVWANPSYPDLTFLSDPVTDGTLAYNPLRTIKTALTA